MTAVPVKKRAEADDGTEEKSLECEKLKTLTWLLFQTFRSARATLATKVFLQLHSDKGEIGIQTVYWMSSCVVGWISFAGVFLSLYNQPCLRQTQLC